MAIVQVKDAEGSVLDWMVAKCDFDAPTVEGGVVHAAQDYMPFQPSADWAQGGPIVARRQIGLDQFKGQPCRAYLGTPTQYEHAMFAPEGQPLIAAMRCYVSSVLGNEVEVPDELI